MVGRLRTPWTSQCRHGSEDAAALPLRDKRSLERLGGAVVGFCDDTSGGGPMTRRFSTPIAHPGDCEASSHIPFIAGHCEQSRGIGHISNHPSHRRYSDPGRVCRALSAESVGKRPVDSARGQGTITRGRAEINGSVLIE